MPTDFRLNAPLRGETPERTEHTLPAGYKKNRLFNTSGQEIKNKIKSIKINSNPKNHNKTQICKQ